VINGAHSDYLREAAQAVRQEQAAGGAQAHPSAGAKTKQVIDFINKSSPMDAESAARAANLNVQDQTPDEARAAHAVMVDESTRALLAARLDIDVGSTSERFVIAAAEAFVASAKMGRSQAVTAPLRRAVDGLSAGEPEKAMDMIVQLRETVQVEGKAQETESLRDTITAEVLSPKTLLDILKNSNQLPDDRRQSYLKGLSKVLECIQSQHFESAITYLPEAPPGQIRELLMAFLRRAGRGHETKVGALFDTADVELGLELVRLLVSMDTDAAREAIALASRSPHPLVRIEALGHLEGVSGARVRAEMRKLLEDDQLDVRLAALSAMQQYAIAAAGPFLVLRIQDKAFLKLPLDEREQSLKTLSVLRPKRCEEVCVVLLQETKLLRPSALESTRELAAKYLAEVASTDEAYRLLESVAQSKPWHNGKSVREAAAAAVARLTERAQQAIDARKSAVEAKRAAGDGPPRSTAARRKRKTQPGGRTSATGTAAPSTASARDDATKGEATADGHATADERSALREARKTEPGEKPGATRPGGRGRTSSVGGGGA